MASMPTRWFEAARTITGAVEGYADNVGGVAGYDGNDEESDLAPVSKRFIYHRQCQRQSKITIGGILGPGEYKAELG